MTDSVTLGGKGLR